MCVPITFSAGVEVWKAQLIKSPFCRAIAQQKSLLQECHRVLPTARQPGGSCCHQQMVGGAATTVPGLSGWLPWDAGEQNYCCVSGKEMQNHSQNWGALQSVFGRVTSVRASTVSSCPKPCPALGLSAILWGSEVCRPVWNFPLEFVFPVQIPSSYYFCPISKAQRTAVPCPSEKWDRGTCETNDPRVISLTH